MNMGDYQYTSSIELIRRKFGKFGYLYVTLIYSTIVE